MNNGNLPASPITNEYGVPTRHFSAETGEEFETSGLTKREYFAAMAMQSLIQAEPHWEEQGYTTPTDEDMAKEAINRADALLKALEGGQNEHARN